MESRDPSAAERLCQVFGSEVWIEDLAHTNPAVAEGLRRFVDLATRDAALSTAIKLLYMAVIAAAKQEEALAAILLKRAIDSGLTPSQAHGAAAALVLSRGVPAFSIFARALHRVFGPAGDTPPSSTFAAESKEAVEYVTSVYGEVPSRVQLMIEELPGALESLNLWRSAALRDAGLSAKHTELLLVSLNSALYESEFVASHARDARDEGATEGELAEAIVAAVPLGGMAAWSTGATAIVSSRASGSRREGSE